MSEKAYETGHCPKCGSKRADVLADYKDEVHLPDYDEVTFYRILECRGCGNNYFKSASSNTEDYDYIPNDVGVVEQVYNEIVHYWPPAAKRIPPDWADEIHFVDRVLGSLFGDVYTALSNNLNVLAAIGMRTVFDRASELLGIDPGRTFRQKLQDLKDSDHITDKEAEVLNTLIDAGSAAAHRGWQPKPKQLNSMMIILEGFLHRAFLLPDIGKELGEGVPPRD